MRKLKFFLAAMLLIPCMGIQAQRVISQGGLNNNDGQSHMRKLQLAEFAISNLYVDSVDEHKLVEDAIKGMLEKLDPHSTYSTAEEVKRMNEALNGNFEGIGVQFNMVEDTLLIIQPISGGPSEKMGILAGDRITTVYDPAQSWVKLCHEENILGQIVP